jgi:hypothetical protein
VVMTAGAGCEAGSERTEPDGEGGENDSHARRPRNRVRG